MPPNVRFPLMFADPPMLAEPFIVAEPPSSKLPFAYIPFVCVF